MDKFSLINFDVQRFDNLGVTLSGGTSVAGGRINATVNTIETPSDNQYVYLSNGGTATSVVGTSFNIGSGATGTNTYLSGVTYITANTTVTITGSTAGETFNLNAGGAVKTGGANSGTDNIYNNAAASVTVTVSGSGSTAITNNNADGTTTVVFDTAGLNNPVTFNGNTGKIFVDSNEVLKTESYSNGNGIKITFTDSNVLTLSDKTVTLGGTANGASLVSQNFYYDKNESTIKLTSSGAALGADGAAAFFSTGVTRLNAGSSALNVALGNNITQVALTSGSVDNVTISTGGVTFIGSGLGTNDLIWASDTGATVSTVQHLANGTSSIAYGDDGGTIIIPTAYVSAIQTNKIKINAAFDYKAADSSITLTSAANGYTLDNDSSTSKHIDISTTGIVAINAKVNNVSGLNIATTSTLTDVTLASSGSNTVQAKGKDMKVTYTGGTLHIFGADNSDTIVVANSQSVLGGTYGTVSGSGYQLTLNLSGGGSIVMHDASSTTAVATLVASDGGYTNNYTPNYVVSNDGLKLTALPGTTTLSHGANADSSTYKHQIQEIDASYVTLSSGLEIGSNVTKVTLNKGNGAENITLATAGARNVVITGADASDTIYANSYVVGETKNQTGGTILITFDDSKGSLTIPTVAAAHVRGADTNDTYMGISEKFDYNKANSTITLVKAADVTLGAITDHASVTGVTAINATAVTGKLTIDTLASDVEDLQLGTGGAHIQDGFSSNTVLVLTDDITKSERATVGGTAGTDTLILTTAKNGTVTLTSSVAGGAESGFDGQFKFLQYRIGSGTPVTVGTQFDYDITNKVKTITYRAGDTIESTDSNYYPAGFNVIDASAQTDIADSHSATIVIPTVTGATASSITLKLGSSTGVVTLSSYAQENITYKGGKWSISSSNSNDKIKFDSNFTSAVTSTTLIGAEVGEVQSGRPYQVNFANGDYLVIQDGASEAGIIDNTGRPQINKAFMYEVKNASTEVTLIGTAQAVTIGTLPGAVTNIDATRASDTVTFSTALGDSTTQVTVGAATKLVLSGGGASNVTVSGMSDTFVWNGYQAGQVAEFGSGNFNNIVSSKNITTKVNGVSQSGWALTVSETGVAKTVDVTVTGSNLTSADLRAKGSTTSLAGISVNFDYDGKTDTDKATLTIVKGKTGVKLGDGAGYEKYSTNTKVIDASGASGSIDIKILDDTTNGVEVKLEGSAANATVTGNSDGNGDTVTAGTGTLYFNGQAGTGADKVTFGVKGGTAYGGGGSDTIDASAATSASNPVYIDGGAGDDKISLGAGGGSVYGGGGNDDIDASQITSNKFYINAGAGNDNITLGSGYNQSTLVTDGSDTVIYNGGLLTVLKESSHASGYSTIKAGDNLTAVTKTENNAADGTIKVTFDGNSKNVITIPNTYIIADRAGTATLAGISKYYNTTALNEIQLLSTTNAPITIQAYGTIQNDEDNIAYISTDVTKIDATKAVVHTAIDTHSDTSSIAISLGEAGNDVTIRGNGSVTATKDKGTDKITYAGGIVSLSNLSADDKVYIAADSAGTITSATHGSGNNSILTISFSKAGRDNTLYIASADADKVLKTNGEDIKEISSKFSYDRANSEITLLSKTTQLTVDDYGTEVKKIDASAVASAATINLKDGNDGIKVDFGTNDKGGIIYTSSKADTIVGEGKGDITVVSGSIASGGIGDYVKLDGTGGGYFNFAGNGNTVGATLKATSATNYIRVNAGSGADLIEIGDGKANITDLGGANTIKAGSGNVTITTGADNDLIEVNGAAVINAGAGKNTIKSGDAAINVIADGTDANLENNITLGIGGGTINAQASTGVTKVNATTAENSVYLYGGASTTSVTLGTNAGGLIDLTKGSNASDTVIYNGGTLRIMGTDAKDTIKVGTLIDSQLISKTERVVIDGNTYLSVTFGDPGTKSTSVLTMPYETKLWKSNGSETYKEVSSLFTYTAGANDDSAITLSSNFPATIVGAASSANTLAVPDGVHVINTTLVQSDAPVTIASVAGGATLQLGRAAYVSLDNQDEDILQLGTSAGGNVSVVGFESSKDVIKLPTDYSLVSSGYASEQDTNTLVVTLRHKSGDTTTQQKVYLVDGANVTDSSKAVTSVTLVDAKGNVIGGEQHNGISSKYFYDVASKSITLHPYLPSATIVSGEDGTDYPSTVLNINMNNTVKAVNFTGNSNANNITVGASGGTIAGGDGADTFVLDAKNIANGLTSDVTIVDYTTGDKIVFNSETIVTATSIAQGTITATLATGKTLKLKDVADESLSVYQTKNGQQVALSAISNNFTWTATNSAGSDGTVSIVSGFGGIIGGTASGAIAYPDITSKIDASATSEDLIINLQDKVTGVTLKASGGADTIYYTPVASSEVTVTGFDAENDVIRLTTSANVQSTTWVGDSSKDLRIAFTDGSSIVATGVKNTDFKFLNSDGKTQVSGISGYYNYDNGGSITLNAEITDLDEISASLYPSGVVTIDAASITTDMVVNGNAKDNYIQIGKGGSYIGGEGNDTFVYTDGTVTISDYNLKGSDKIKIDGTAVTGIQKTEYDGNDLVITFESGKVLTVTNAKGKTLDVTSTQAGSDTITAAISGFFGFDANIGTITLNDAATSIDKGSYPSNTTKIDASALSKGVTLELNTKITGVTGTTAGDTFIFTGGSDATVSGVTSADKIQLKATGNTLYKTQIESSTGDLKVYLASDTAGTNSTTNILTLEGLANPDSWVPALSVTDGNGIAVNGISGYYSYAPHDNTITLNSALTGTLANSQYPTNVKNIIVDPSNNQQLIVNGNALANTIKGGLGANSLLGAAGNDSLYGSEDTAKSEGDYLNGGAGNDYIEVKKADNVLIGDAGKDTLIGGTGNDTFDGGNDNDLIKAGGGDANSLFGGAGNDTLWGSSSTNATALTTMTGGQNNDVFIFNGEAELIITDYTAGQDVIKLSGINGASVGSSSVDGKDVILNVVDAVTTTTSLGKVTVMNVVGKELTVYRSTGSESFVEPAETRIFGYYNATEDDADNKIISLNADFEGTLDTKTYSTAVTVIDATSVTNDITINGNAKHNSIYGGEGSDKIYGSTGNDTLTAYSSDTTKINAGDDTIYGGAGTDLIYGSSSGNNVLYGETENDTIKGLGGNNTIYGGAGADSLMAENGDNYITGENDNDYIEVKATGNNTLYGGAGNDTISVVSGGTGTTGNNFINGDAGNDYINVTVSTGLNTIYGAGDKDTIYGGDGDDYIDGGAADDYISGGKGYNTLIGGAGNDTFLHESDADANDIITTYDGTGKDRIVLASTDSIGSSKVNENDVILNVVSGGADKGTITIQNAKEKVIDVYKADGTLLESRVFGYYNYGTDTGANVKAISLNSDFEEVTLKSTVYPTDTRLIYADSVEAEVYVQGNAQNNTIHGSNYDDTLEGGAGDDYLLGNDGANSLVGGAGDDTLVAGKDENTLTGGAGSDLYIYTSGNDVITEYEVGKDKIRLSTTTVVSTAVDGANVILTLGDDNNVLTINNAKDKVITLEEYKSDGNYIKTEGIFGYFTYERNNADKIAGITLNADYAGPLATTTYATTVTTIDASLVDANIVINGNTQANHIIGSSNNDAETIYGGAGDDTIEGKGAAADVFYGGDGNDSLVGNASADILYGDAGNDTLEGGDDDDSLYGGTGNDTLDGGAGSDYLEGGDGNDSLNGGEGNDSLIGGAGKDSLIADAGDNYFDGGADADYIVAATLGSDTIKGGDGNDTIVHRGSDIIITDYKFNAKESDVISLSSGKVGSSTLEGNDVILNIVDDNGGDNGTVTVVGAKDSSIRVVYSDGTTETRIFGYYDYDNTNKNAITLNAGFSGTLNSTLYPSDVVSIDAASVQAEGTLTIYGNDKANYIAGSDGIDAIYGDAAADTILGNGGDDTLIGGAGNDSLLGGEGADSINGGDGNDTIEGGKDNDTLVGGAGTDVFVFAEGEDVITDYEENKDVIRYDTASAVSLASSSIDGKDVVLTFQNGGTVTVKNAKDKKIKLGALDDAADPTGKIYGYYLEDPNDANSVTISSSFAEKEFNAKTYNSDITNINASLLEDGNAISIRGTDKGTNIIGSSNNDTIIGGKAADTLSGESGNDVVYGGSGADTLYGGDGDDILYGEADNDYLAGNSGLDTLVGGAGNDTFAYIEGDDIITDYETGKDMIELPSTTLVTSSLNGNDVVLELGTGGYITVKGAKDKKITLADATSTVSGVFGYFDGVGQATISVNSAFAGTELNEKMYKGDVVVEAIDASQLTDKGIIIRGNSNSATSILGGSGNDSIYGGSQGDTLLGGDGDDYIFGTSGNNSMEGGEGNDTIVGGTGSDSLDGGDGDNVLTGGTGVDYFVFSSGNDTITDYKVGEDVIALGSADVSISSSSINGDDVILNVGEKGTITVKNTKGKKIRVVNELAGTDNTRVFGYFDYESLDAGGSITLTADFPEKEIKDAIYGEDVTAINGQLLGKGITFYANSKASEGTSIIGSNYNDVIIGASGKNDTLDGGDGKDTLTGISGNNYFVHSKGEDIITDYTYNDNRQDVIILTDTLIGKANISGKDVVITTTGDGVITIKNAKDKYISIAQSGTSPTEATARIYGYYNYGQNDDGGEDTNTVVINSDFKEKKFIAESLAPEATVVDASEVERGVVIESGHSETSIRIIGSDYNDKLTAGNNGDTLQGNDGTDTLVGGAGADVFLHTGGSDYIENYDSDADVIMLSETSLASSSVSGKNVVLTLESGKIITVKNAKDQKLTVVDATGSELTTETRVFGYYSYDSETQTITLNQNFSESAGLNESHYNTEVQVIDASKVSKSVKVTAGSSANMTIVGSNSNDKLNAGTAQSVYINGGKGNDQITGGSEDDTLIGGEGADTLEGKGGNDTFIYVGGAEVIKDYVYDGDQSDVIVISDGAVVSSTVRSKDVVLTISKNNTITVKNAKDATLSVVDSTGTDTRVFGYYSYGETTETIVLNSDFVDKALTTDQYVSEITTIDGSSLTKGLAINGNEKDNVITGGKYADKIDGGNGADSISAGDGNDSINGGEGDDTIIGGAGNDTFVGGDGADRFVYVAGNDVIADYSNGDSDVVKLSSGKVGTSNYKGTDIVLNVVDVSNARKAIGTITLKGQKNKEITVIDANDVSDTRLFGYYSYGDTTDTIILNSDFGGMLYSTTTDNAAYYSSSVVVVDGSNVKKASNIQGNGANTITGGTANDTITAGSGNSYLAGGAGNDSLIGGDGADTLVGGAGNDTMYGAGGANTFVFTAGSEVVADYSAGENNVIRLSSGRVTASTVKNGTDVVLTVGNKGTLTVKNASATELTVIDASGTSETRLFGYYDYADATKTITLNTDFKGTLGSATGEGTAFYAADVVNIDASKVNNSIVIQGNGIANKITAAKKSTTIVAGTGANTIIGGNAADSIIGGDGTDSISAGTGNDIVSGGDGADILDGGAGNDSLNGDAGADSIYAGAGNDTLTGGDGNDIFVYSAGADIITDYVSGSDVISISGGTVTASTVKNGNVVLTVGSKGTITVVNGKNQNLTVAQNNSTVTGIFGYYTGQGTNSIKLNADFTGTLYAEQSDENAYYPSNIATIDGSQVKNAITIMGNSNNNRITAGKRNTTIDGGAGNDTLIGGAGADSLYGGEGADVLTGGAGNDTLYGGAGNDTLSGGAGRDVFMYSGGSDVITDYVAGQDTIRADGVTVSRSAASGSDLIFTMSNGSAVTVKNGNGKKVTFIDSNGLYNGSNGNIAVSGRSSNAVDDFWFTEDDDNFTTSSSGAKLDDISSLSDNDYSVTSIEGVDYTDITKDSRNAADKLVSSTK
ncbi:MAG: hypothetical protein J5809_05895 [Selenomonadaceae bacterium]|nr:hypothetical protein [Selenomonadaceae bacterium]